MQEKLIIVPKKTLFLVLPYLGPLSLQNRTKLRKSLKGILNCCKLRIVFKSQNKLAKAFCFKDRIPKELTSGAVYMSTLQKLYRASWVYLKLFQLLLSL